MWNKARRLPRMPRLAVRLLLEVLGALVLAAGVCLAAAAIESAVISRYSASGRQLDAVLEPVLADLQDYVTQNHLSTRDSAALRTWDKGNSVVELQLVANGAVIYSSADYGWARGSHTGIAYLRVEDPSLSVIHFSDGDATVALNPAYYHNLERRLLVITIVVCCALFGLLTALRFSMLIRDVLRIDEGVQMLESGDLTYRIQVASPDELGELASSLNRMAEELQWRNQLEDKLHQQNYDMITALSHDLRTPLTAILGYTELLEAGPLEPSREQEYLRRIRERADFIRQMTDRLFDSAQTRTKAREQLQELNGQVFFAEALESMTRSLAVAGFDLVAEQQAMESFRLEADPVQLTRVFSNLEGNIRSYADPAAPIRVRATLDGGMLHIVQTNRIRESAGRAGTGVGLRTAQAILSGYGGSLTTQRTAGVFTLDLRLPVL